MAKLNISLDEIFRNSPLGSLDCSIANTLYGINHRQVANLTPPNKEVFGLTFLTRPALNLTTQNARADRRLIPLLTQESSHYQRYIRCMLDPRLNYSNRSFECSLIDHDNPFIPLLTNQMSSLSGWPDPSLDTFTSAKGVYNEQFSIVDSIMDIFWSYDMTATFRSMVGDPISAFFYTWMLYISNVYKGVMVPYPDMIALDEIDYQTRIYRLVLDRTKRKIVKYACTGVCVPYSINIGSSFNFESDKVYNDAFDQIEVGFRCSGALYNDPIIIEDFNDLVGIFCESMKPATRESNMQKVDISILDIFNFQGYPYINPDTLDLDWYVYKTTYDKVVRSYDRQYNALYSTTTATR
jgi:hypothetical protein